MKIAAMNFGLLSDAFRTKQRRPAPGTWALICGGAGIQGGSVVTVAQLVDDGVAKWLTTNGDHRELARFPYWRPVRAEDRNALELVKQWEQVHGGLKPSRPIGPQ